MNWLKCKLQVGNNWDVKNKAKFQPCTDYLNLIYYPTCLIVFVVFSNVCVCVCNGNGTCSCLHEHAHYSHRFLCFYFLVFIKPFIFETLILKNSFQLFLQKQKQKTINSVQNVIYFSRIVREGSWTKHGGYSYSEFRAPCKFSALTKHSQSIRGIFQGFPQQSVWGGWV